MNDLYKKSNDFTSQYNWDFTSVVSFLELAEHFPFAWASYQLITPSSLFSPVQILADVQWDTHPSSQDVPLDDLET